jgi:hypothetical protein
MLAAMGNPGPMLSKNFLATPPNSTLIYGLSCCARYAGTNAPRVPCPDNGRILLANPQIRNLCVQHAFFEGKKTEETSPRKSTSRTLK